MRRKREVRVTRGIREKKGPWIGRGGRGSTIRDRDHRLDMESTQILQHWVLLPPLNQRTTQGQCLGCGPHHPKKWEVGGSTRQRVAKF